MNIKLQGVSRIVSRQVLHVRKQSPHILFGVGLAGTVASTVLACRATLKLEDKLDELAVHHNNLKAVKDGLDKGLGTVSRKDYTQEACAVYTKTGLELTKLYGPAILVGAASIACLTGSHIQLTRRNTALMAAYAAIEKAYNDYRVRVRNAVGEVEEQELYLGTKTETVKNEMGKQEIVRDVDPHAMSAYAKFFDETTPNWKPDPEFNRIFLQAQQSYANQLLRSRGHLFLNEVYDMLGLDRTREGSVVGWFLGKDGDNYVDFGIFEGFSRKAREFVNGREHSILLDFNVDGLIYNLI